MPNRLIKESICTSESINRLTAFQEIFFYRLIVNCDDYGRMDARPQIIASKLFPLKGIRLNQINDALQALTSEELVFFYQVDGKPFLQMTTWDKHQQIRARRGKYPAPEEGDLISSDITCKQLISSDITCSPNPIQSNPNPNPNPNPTRTRARRTAPDDGRFDTFWAAYPRHDAKMDARKAFDKLNPDDELMGKMLKAIEDWKQTDQWKENGGQFIPYPATWLNKHRWEDEIPASRNRSANVGKPVSAQQYAQRDYGNKEQEAFDRMMSNLLDQYGDQI